VIYHATVKRLVNVEEAGDDVRDDAISCHHRPRSSRQSKTSFLQRVCFYADHSRIRQFALQSLLQCQVTVLDEAKHLEYVAAVSYPFDYLGDIVWLSSTDESEYCVQLLVLLF
jgi:hypothetical protein